MAELDEQQLMIRARRGDADAFGVIVRCYLERIYRVAHRILRNHDDAAEVAQDTFLRAYRGIDRFDPDRPVFPWLYRIARNLSLNRIERTRGRETSLPEFDTIESRLGGPEESAMIAQDAREVRCAVASLPEQFRTIIELNHFEECSYSEIAAILDIPIGTVMSRLYHARRRLRQLLEQEDRDYADQRR